MKAVLKLPPIASAFSHSKPTYIFLNFQYFLKIYFQKYFPLDNALLNNNAFAYF